MLQLNNPSLMLLVSNPLMLLMNYLLIFHRIYLLQHHHLLLLLMGLLWLLEDRLEDIISQLVGSRRWHLILGAAAQAFTLVAAGVWAPGPEPPATIRIT